MSTYSQLPGVLNLTVKSGDDFSTVVDFDISLAGYTVSSFVTSLVSGVNVTPIGTTISNAGLGQVTVTMADTETSSLTPGSYGWSLRWVSGTGETRNALGGILEVVK